MDSYLVLCPTCKANNRIPPAKAGLQGKCGNCQDPLPALYIEPVTLTDETFGSFVKNYNGPILAEFWAPW